MAGCCYDGFDTGISVTVESLQTVQRTVWITSVKTMHFAMAAWNKHLSNTSDNSHRCRKIDGLACRCIVSDCNIS